MSTKNPQFKIKFENLKYASKFELKASPRVINPKSFPRSLMAINRKKSSLDHMMEIKANTKLDPISYEMPKSPTKIRQELLSKDQILPESTI